MKTIQVTKSVSVEDDVDVEITKDDVIEYIESVDDMYDLHDIQESLADKIGELMREEFNSELQEYKISHNTLADHFKLKAIGEVWDTFTDVDFEEMINDYKLKKK